MRIEEQKKPEPLFAIQGQLLKKAGNFFKGWLPKHVILQNKILRYYNVVTKQGQVRPLNDNIFVDYFGDNADGFFNFETYQTSVKRDGRDITLIIFGAERSFVFRAASESEARSWHQEIKKHIS